MSTYTGPDSLRRGKHTATGGARQRLVIDERTGRPTIKPRDRAKYTPRPRNGTPRRLHATERTR